MNQFFYTNEPFITALQNNDNINLLHLYSAFLDTQSALHCEVGSPHPPPVCSTTWTMWQQS